MRSGVAVPVDVEGVVGAGSVGTGSVGAGAVAAGPFGGDPAAAARPRGAAPHDWRAELRVITAAVGSRLVEELFVLVGCTMWWISCLGVAGGVGFVVAEWSGLVIGLLVGASAAVAGWLMGMAAAVRDLVLTWRSGGG